ncbi:hypothetical protein ACFYZH_31870 [Streptomyces abikoensis]|uniref:hypothetical protein n=1 Tax=Streptomyces abikoensis TaxID=97398 RepID=UPI00368C6C9C
MPREDYWEVDVPIYDADNHLGLHVFTGRAASPGDALAAAHAVYAAARLLSAAGREIPRADGDGWAARGLRPGWVLDWEHAHIKKWVNPNNLL